jgi:hypothetical protein
MVWPRARWASPGKIRVIYGRAFVPGIGRGGESEKEGTPRPGEPDTANEMRHETQRSCTMITPLGGIWLANIQHAAVSNAVRSVMENPAVVSNHDDRPVGLTAATNQFHRGLS